MKSVQDIVKVLSGRPSGNFMPSACLRDDVLLWLKHVIRAAVSMRHEKALNICFRFAARGGIVEPGA